MAVRLGANAVTMMQTVKDRKRQIVTPRYDRFMDTVGEIIFDPWVVDAVTERLLKRQTARSGRLGASSAGRCLRAQVLTYLGAPGRTADTQLLRIYQDGHWRHMRLQALLLQAGIIDRVEFPVRWKRVRASGDIDGMGIVPDDHPVEEWRGKDFGLEIKGAMSFAFANIEKLGPERYYDQVARYFLYSGLDLFVILVESKDTQAMVEYVVTEQDVDMGRQLHELQVVNDHIDQRQLPAKQEMCALARGPVFKSCPFGLNPDGACHSFNEKW